MGDYFVLAAEPGQSSAALVHERDRGDDDGRVPELALREHGVDDKRLAEAGRRGEHDVLAFHQPVVHHGLLGVEYQIPRQGR